PVGGKGVPKEGWRVVLVQRGHAPDLHAPRGPHRGILHIVDDERDMWILANIADPAEPVEVESTQLDRASLPVHGKAGRDDVRPTLCVNRGDAAKLLACEIGDLAVGQCAARHMRSFPAAALRAASTGSRVSLQVSLKSNPLQRGRTLGTDRSGEPRA